MAKHTGNQEKARKLSEFVDYYEVCNRAEGKSPKTISWYSANLRHFHRYLGSRHLPDSMLEMVRRYVSLASNHVVIQHQRFSPLDRLNLCKV